MARSQTPSQTVGPFFAYALTPRQYGYPLPQLAGSTLCGEAAAGERIWLVGQVIDGEGAPVDDALIELWQPDAAGRYRTAPAASGEAAGDPDVAGFGRCGTGTDPHSRFVFRTIKPGAPDGESAPHLSLVVFMRGLLSHLYTRVYFDDEADANARDAVLAQVPAARRDTLIARRTDSAEGPVYLFDIRMQGDGETVFFDV